MYCLVRLVDDSAHELASQLTPTKAPITNSQPSWPLLKMNSVIVPASGLLSSTASIAVNASTAASRWR